MYAGMQLKNFVESLEKISPAGIGIRELNNSVTGMHFYVGELCYCS